MGRLSRWMRAATLVLLAFAIHCSAGPSPASSEAGAPIEPDASTPADAPSAADAAAPADARGDVQGSTDGGSSRDAPPAPNEGGVPSYDPCPKNGSPCVLLALGDSITWGVGTTAGGSYRAPLFHLANQAHQSITFVGSVQTGPTTVDGKPFPSSNEGHPGYTIDDSDACSPACKGIAPLVPNAITTFKPNIVLLMIGTNDVFLSLDLTNAPARLGKLIDTITSLDPAILVVVAEVIPSTDDAQNARTQTYNAAMPAVVQARATAGAHVFLVDMYSAFVAEPDFKTKYMSDNLHPSDTGAAVMASTWYAALGPLFQ
jgi:lysophospholipase L1-like esterase